MRYYFAALLNDNGLRHPVDRGGGVSQNAALRVAIRLANAERHDACVVELDSATQEETIVQTVRYREDMVTHGPVTDSQSNRFMLAPLPLSPDAVEFITKWIQQGRSVTVSPARMTAEPSVNIIASVH